MYVYVQSESWTDEDGTRNNVYTVGFYDPTGRFIPESDHDNKNAAADRVSFLNGGIQQ
jgi:hypothetical protein